MYSKYYFFCFILFICCKSSSEDWLEQYSLYKCEVQKLEKKTQAEFENATNSLSSRKANLEDNLGSAKAVYESQISEYKEAIRESEKKYLEKLRKVKADHFSKYGHRVEHAGSLDKAIEVLRSEKDRRQSLYKEKIKQIEIKLKEDPVIINITAELEALEGKIRDIDNKIENKYKGEMDSLNTRARILEDEKSIKIKRMNPKERASFLRNIDSIDNTGCI